MEAYNNERSLRKIKRHPVPNISGAAAKIGGNKNIPLDGKDVDTFSGKQMTKIAQHKLMSEENNSLQSGSVGGNIGVGSSVKGGITSTGGSTNNFIVGPSSRYNTNLSMLLNDVA